jgi:hypothetical protein
MTGTRFSVHIDLEIAKDRSLDVGDCRVGLGLPRSVVDPAVVQAANKLLSEVDGYAKSATGSRSQKLIELASTLKVALDASNKPGVDADVAALSDLLGHDSGYQQFVAAQEAAGSRRKPMRWL